MKLLYFNTQTLSHDTNNNNNNYSFILQITVMINLFLLFMLIWIMAYLNKKTDGKI